MNEITTRRFFVELIYRKHSKTGQRPPDVWMASVRFINGSDGRSMGSKGLTFYDILLKISQWSIHMPAKQIMQQF
jgi:hypothetical protein